MPKKLISILLLLSVVTVLALVVTTGEGQASLSALYVDEDTWNQLQAARTQRLPDGTAQMQLADALYFNGYKLPYDRLDQVLLYSLVEDDPRANDPLVELICYGEKADIAFFGDAVTEDTVKGSRSIQAMVYTDDEYALYQLRLTTLPVLEIIMEESPFTVKDESVTVRMRLFDNRREALNRQLDTSVSIHMRGRNSKMYPKNDYRISLRSLSLGNNWRNYPVSLLGMRADEDWILKGMYNDNRKIREVFSTELWYDSCARNNVFGIVNGNQYRYVEVFFGNYYWGLYALTHPVDAKQLGIQSGTGEHLYKKTSAFSELKMDFDRELDTAIDVNDQSDPRVAYTYDGGDREHPDYGPLLDYYRTLLRTEPEMREKLYAIADTDNAIDIFLFLNLIQGIDHLKTTGGLFNVYLSAKNDAEGVTRMLYTPWDMDRTWGLGFGDVDLMDPATHVVMNTNPVVQLKELGDQAILDRLAQRYRELRQGAWSEENIARMLHAYEEKVFFSGAYERDFQRWYRFMLPPEYIPEYHTDYAGFAAYVNQRLQHLDQFVLDYTQSGR